MKKSKSQFDWLLFRRLLCGIFIVFFIITGLISIKVYFDTKKDQALVDQNVRAIATYEHITSSHQFGFAAWYEYIDENGVRYSGISGRYSKREDAVQLVGTQVEIFIDGKGQSLRVDFGLNLPSLWYSISFTISSFALAVGLIAVTVVLETRPKRKRRQLERAHQALVEELSKIRAQKEV